jgi:hypothetical protein
MRLDIYRRPEHEHKLSFLAVPEGQPIPEEATNVDWATEARGKELDDSAASWPELGIDAPGRQLREKGYAITGVTHQVDEAGPR